MNKSGYHWPAVLASILIAGQAALAGTATNAPVVCGGSFSAGGTNETMNSIATGVSELLQVYLAQNNVKVVERERFLEIMKEQTLGPQGFSDPATAVRIGALLGATKIINGSASLVNGELIIIANILDVQTAGIQASKKVIGKQENLSDLALNLAGQLAQALSANYVPATAGELEKHPNGSLYFLKGLGFFNSGNYDNALAAFMSCGDVEPDHPTCHYWIALCYFRLEEFDHARIEFNRFLKDSPRHDKASEAQRLCEECKAKFGPPKPILLSP